METRQGHVESVQSDGSATVTIGGDPEPVPGVASDSNYVPVAGDTVWLEIADTETTILRKDGTSPSALAGMKTTAMVTTLETRAAITYGALATAGPSLSVTIGDSGVLMVGISCLIQPTSDNDGGAVSVALSGANTVASSDSKRISFIGMIINAQAEFGKTLVFTGLNPGATTVTMQYKDLFDTGNDVGYGNRELWAWPL